MLLLSLLACPPSKTDTAAPDDTATPDDTAVEHVADPGPASAWTLVDACSTLRLELTDGVYHVAIRLDANMYDAITAGSPYAASQEWPDVDLIATDGAFVGADVCSSIEEWPTTDADEAWWTGTAGTVEIAFTPDQAWSGDATWDGTELGDIEVVLTGATLDPAGIAVGTLVVPDITVSGRFHKLELPA